MLYKSIHIPNLEVIQDELLLVIPKEKLYKTDLFYLPKTWYMDRPLIRSLFKDLGLLEHISVIATVIITPKQNILPIHIDAGPTEWSFNIPVRNCNGTSTTWYKTDKEPQHISRGDKDGGYGGFDDKYCIEIDKLEMTHAHLINVKVPHTVSNPTDKIRILNAVRLEPTFKMELYNG